MSFIYLLSHKAKWWQREVGQEFMCMQNILNICFCLVTYLLATFCLFTQQNTINVFIFLIMQHKNPWGLGGGGGEGTCRPSSRPIGGVASSSQCYMVGCTFKHPGRWCGYILHFETKILHTWSVHCGLTCFNVTVRHGWGNMKHSWLCTHMHVFKSNVFI